MADNQLNSSGQVLGGFGVIEQNRSQKKAQKLDGEWIEYCDMLNHNCGMILYELIRKEKPEFLLELGMCHGTSTMYMLQALADNGKGKLISCDPGQIQDGGVGLQCVKRSGLGHLHEFFETQSEVLLPLLMLDIRKGERPPFDFVFIDTNHQFDQTIVELYYTDRILREGGITVLDDTPHAAVWTACRFWEANRDHYFHVIHDEPNRPGLEVMTVFQKMKPDRRPWWHFVPFEVSMKPYKVKSRLNEEKIIL